MSTAYRCDRCHELRDGFPVLEVKLAEYEGEWFGKRWEICGPCVRELEPWFRVLEAVEGAGGDTRADAPAPPPSRRAVRRRVRRRRRPWRRPPCPRSGRPPSSS